MNNLKIDTSKWGWRENRAASSNRSASRRFCVCMWASNHYLQKGLTWSVVKTSSLAWLEGASKPFFCSRTLCSVATTCKYKDLIRSPVWGKYCRAFLREVPPHGTRWEPWRWRRGARRPVSLSPCSSNQHLALREPLRCLADTKSPPSLQTSTHSLNIILDMWRVCVSEILTTSPGRITQAIKLDIVWRTIIWEIKSRYVGAHKSSWTGGCREGTVKGCIKFYWHETFNHQFVSIFCAVNVDLAQHPRQEISAVDIFSFN